MALLLQHVLAESAGRLPDQTALLCRGRAISYRQLDKLSDQLAQTLLEEGVERGGRVGICLSKSIEAVVAVFGILKCGAAYVPLDYFSPPSRLALIAGDCGIQALITTTRKASRILAEPRSDESVKVLILTDTATSTHLEMGPGIRALFWEEVMATSSRPSRFPRRSEDDLAYLLYTSGSTGTPKGVMITHRASLSFVNWASRYFQLSRKDRVSNHAPLQFDLSIFDIFATFRSGATLVAVPEELSSFPLQLADFIEKQAISVWYSVPSVLIRLVLKGGMERYRFLSLRQVLFAGEVFPVKHLRRLQGRVPHAEFFNLYGPTETNVCTVYPVRVLTNQDSRPVPIGKACSNSEVWALNERGEVARTGETGELYIRGSSLMKGYWGLPKKTSEVLTSVKNAPGAAGGMAYRTGDLVKQLEDGNYVFVGRRDEMVKSRGYRIELGEIEAVLCSHPEVREVAVLAVPDEQIGNALKVIVVRLEDSNLDRAEVENWCARWLPRYMIPTLIGFRDDLPRTSTGKVDKLGLLKEPLQF
ncbi:MAG: amino acid adenylation domain-containing protein [Acidobacteriota bacterium]